MTQRQVLYAGIGSCVAFASGSAILLAAIVAHLNLSSLVFGVMCVLFALSAVAGFFAWLGGMMHAARIGRWDWLLAVLMLLAPGAVLYAARRPAALASVPANAQL